MTSASVPTQAMPRPTSEKDVVVTSLPAPTWATRRRADEACVMFEREIEGVEGSGELLDSPVRVVAVLRERHGLVMEDGAVRHEAARYVEVLREEDGGRESVAYLSVDAAWTLGEQLRRLAEAFENGTSA